MSDDLLDAVDDGEHKFDCVYTSCDASLRDRAERRRHLMDQHGHTWQSANEAVQNYTENVGGGDGD